MLYGGVPSKKKEDSEDTEELKVKLSSKSVSGAIPPKRISNNILTLRSKIADCGGKIPSKIGCFDPTKGKAFSQETGGGEIINIVLFKGFTHNTRNNYIKSFYKESQGSMYSKGSISSLFNVTLFLLLSTITTQLPSAIIQYKKNCTRKAPPRRQIICLTSSRELPYR